MLEGGGGEQYWDQTHGMEAVTLGTRGPTHEHPGLRIGDWEQLLLSLLRSIRAAGAALGTTTAATSLRALGLRDLAESRLRSLGGVSGLAKSRTPSFGGGGCCMVGAATKIAFPAVFATGGPGDGFLRGCFLTGRGSFFGGGRSGCAGIVLALELGGACSGIVLAENLAGGRGLSQGA